jgi:hypothetical protein
MAGFLGMRGSGDWAANERPENWRQGILYEYPNGAAPLTGLLSKMKTRKVDDSRFHWWTKTLAAQGGAVTGVFTNAALTVAYVSGGVIGTTLYIRMAEAVADEFRVGHQVLLRDASNLNVDVNTKATAVVKNGASSYVASRLLEADDNSATNDLSDCDTALIIGNINPEGGPIPDALTYDPTEWNNYVQTFRNPLDITRIARRTRLRTEDAYKEAKREALEYHSIEMEKAFLFGIATEFTGSNGKLERTTMGLIPAIRAGAAANVSDYTVATAFAGDSWLQSGEQWFDEMLELIFRYGEMEKMAFVGSGALLGINRLAKQSGQIQLTPMTMSYGIKVVQWVTPFGIVYLKTHPLFSFDATTRNSMVVFEPAQLTYCHIDDTRFIPQKEDMVSTGGERLDGTKEEWLTDCGLEYHFPNRFGFLSGLNQNNVA